MDYDTFCNRVLGALAALGLLFAVWWAWVNNKSDDSGDPNGYSGW
jgi:hypothetical protein